MNLMERMVEQARANKQRIVLPEGTEERTLQAADAGKSCKPRKKRNIYSTSI